MLHPSPTALAGDLDRLGEHAHEPVGDRRRVVAVLEQHDELVAAQPGHQVAVAGRAPQPGGQLDEHDVAGVVAEAVVDRLEAVEVEQQQRRRGPRAAPARRAARGTACGWAARSARRGGRRGAARARARAAR